MRFRGRVIPTLLLLVIAEASLLSVNRFEWGAAERGPYTYRLDWVALWGGSGYENAKGVATYGGAVYVDGTTRSFGAGLSDVFLLKYNATGKLLWSRTWGGSSYDGSWGLAACEGGVYVAGFTYPIGSAVASLALLKYDLDGRLIWVRTWGAGEDAVGRGVAVAGDGYVYVTGYLRGEVTTKESFLLKFSPDGNLVWEKSIGGEGVNAFSVEASGDTVYVDGTNESAAGGQWSSEMFLTKLDEAGDVAWTRTWSNGPINYCWALSANGADVYQAGTTGNGAGDLDCVLLDYDPAGNLRYSVIWGKEGEQYAWGVDRDEGYIYLAGHTLAGGVSSYDAIVVKFTLDGAPVWNVTWGGRNSDVARSVAVQGDDVYVTGITYSEGNDSQAFLLKYTSPNIVSSPLASLTAAGAAGVGVTALVVYILRAAELGRPPRGHPRY